MEQKKTLEELLATIEDGYENDVSLVEALKDAKRARPVQCGDSFAVAVVQEFHTLFLEDASEEDNLREWQRSLASVIRDFSQLEKTIRTKLSRCHKSVTADELAAAFEIPVETAQTLIERYCKGTEDEAADNMDRLASSLDFPVERMEGMKVRSNYWHDTGALYVDTGNCDQATLIYDTTEDKWVVMPLSTWTDANCEAYLD